MSDSLVPQQHRSLVQPFLNPFSANLAEHRFQHTVCGHTLSRHLTETRADIQSFPIPQF